MEVISKTILSKKDLECLMNDLNKRVSVGIIWTDIKGIRNTYLNNIKVGLLDINCNGNFSVQEVQLIMRYCDPDRKTHKKCRVPGYEISFWFFDQIAKNKKKLYDIYNLSDFSIKEIEMKLLSPKMKNFMKTDYQKYVSHLIEYVQIESFLSNVCNYENKELNTEEEIVSFIRRISKGTEAGVISIRTLKSFKENGAAQLILIEKEGDEYKKKCVLMRFNKDIEFIETKFIEEIPSVKNVLEENQNRFLESFNLTKEEYEIFLRNISMIRGGIFAFQLVSKPDYFTRINKSINHVKEIYKEDPDIKTFLGTIKCIRFERDSENSNTKTFDFIRVNANVIGYGLSRKELIGRLKPIKKKIAQKCLEKVEKSKRFQSYEIPVNFLKLTKMTLLSDSSLELVFELKEIKEEQSEK